MSKPILDETDRVLAAHYGFTDEELDFIINYASHIGWGATRRTQQVNRRKVWILK